LSAGEEATIRAYLAEAGYEVLAGAITERIAYREAQNRGQALTETKVAKLNREADALMEALLDRVAVEIGRLKERARRKPREAS
jgi:chromosome partitioning protein